MASKKKIIIILMILIIILSLTGITIFTTYHSGKSSYHGKHNLLILCVDPTEQRSGVGAVDMAFIIKINHGKIGKITPIYPGGLYDPSMTPPADLQNEGANHWYLHDSLWTKDLEEGTKRAQQIVKYNTNINSDIVAVVTPDAIDSMVQAVGPVYSNGQEVKEDTLSFLRSEQKDNGVTRGDTIEGLADGILDAARSNGKYVELFGSILTQHSQGNILVVPSNAFEKLVSYVGISSIIP